MPSVRYYIHHNYILQSNMPCLMSRHEIASYSPSYLEPCASTSTAEMCVVDEVGKAVYLAKGPGSPPMDGGVLSRAESNLALFHSSNLYILG
jgi:hypothetical protein